MLAQQQFGLNAGMNNQNQNNNPPQPVGAAIPGGNNNNNRGAPGRPRGFFNIPAEKSGDFKIVTVCLEHGRKDPKVTIPYRLSPLAAVTTKPGVEEVVRSLADPKTPQRIAQAAAWHLANGMSWDELAAKRIEHLDGTSEPYFAADELRDAEELAKQAEQAAPAADNGGSPSESKAPAGE